LASDTWSGTTASSTNGKDPCAVLGAGWRLPTEAEWQNIALLEDLSGTMAAFQSNLKLTSSGNRGFQNGDIGYYWTSNAANNSYARVFFFDNIYNADVTSSERGQGYSCRCVKD
jgi:formylglycine-generating enzyme required for sulfatase activity